MVNSCVAFGCTSRSGSGVSLKITRFYVIKRDRSCDLLHLDLLSHIAESMSVCALIIFSEMDYDYYDYVYFFW